MTAPVAASSASSTATSIRDRQIVFRHRGMAAVLSALAFAALFVAWTYYPHGLPLPTALTVAPATTAAPAPAAPVAPAKPRNPVTDVTPR